MAPHSLYTLLSLALVAPALAEVTTTITAAPVAFTDVAGDIARRQASSTYETTSPLPLTDYNYPYSAIPYQVNPYAVGRGPQSGYNQCNSTTEGDTSQCQTLIVNSLADFCLWGSPTANNTIGETEAAVVAYCAQSGHGSRIMVPGTITGAQFMRTSAYIQIVGTFDQTGIGLASDDYGGELDPHGADLLGNPLGGLVYSTGMPSGDNSTYMQVQSWNNFVGSNVFCIKLCDPTITSPNYCENRYDLVGCTYNMPSDAYNAVGEFSSCEGELQDVVGTYTGSDGQTTTWSQPATLTSTPPYTPRIPSSSNCVTYSSAELFGSASATASSASVTSTATGSGTGTAKTTSTATSRSGSASGSAASATGTASTSAAQGVKATGALSLVAALLALFVAA